ncbi:TetR/AcrR family transcriptional regulator [Alkalibacter saccharofermentans]|uniref:Transcriptional regulator, TetR family n=1 Tax=Alkalibacter saccharofermentans DSM 14828 TaxID=1120975 RepID=A0A1M4ZCU8_9FIRM|nr:TetR/AcrR family transcriptional regulator [Alkalibacter saccharofermentans]SHF15860.1 transcriptional regulator, TetR family [Alkalibacter saccharofermentans DSM 14828]
MKNQILDEAFSLFSEKGTLFSMQELAKAVGMKAPSLYNYYASKNDLLHDLIAQEIDRYYMFFNRLFENESETSEQLIKDVFYSVIDYYSDQLKAKFRRRLGMIDGNHRQYIKEILAKNDEVIILKLRNVFEDCINKGVIPDHNVDQTLFHYYFVLQGIISNSIYYEKGDKHYANAIDSTWESFWAGLSCFGNDK